MCIRESLLCFTTTHEQNFYIYYSNIYSRTVKTKNKIVYKTVKKFDNIYLSRV